MAELKTLETYKYVFVILVYRNGEDLFDFDKSLEALDGKYKVVLVNSYMNDETEQRIKEIASQLDYDFLSVDNKGYGYGNNRGVEYAKEHYDYQYLIISNSDVVIRNFDTSNLPTQNAVIGPMLTTLAGKKQNPYWAIENKPMEKMIYNGLKNNSRKSMVLAQGTNKVIREAYLLMKKVSNSPGKIYAVHGAFMVFTKDVIDRISPVYDENMFLYYEEAYLANRLNQLEIDRYFYPQIDILHKEDGSTKGLNVDLRGHAVDSFVHYYENHVVRRER